MNLDDKIRYIKKLQREATALRHMEDHARLEYLYPRHQDFADECPALFMGTVKGTLEPEKLNYMLNMSKNVERGNITFDQASVIVGQQLFDDYVKPAINEEEEKKAAAENSR